jgi:hypothetical protein
MKMAKPGKFHFYLSLALAETIALVWFSSIPSAGFVGTGGLLRTGDLEHFVGYAAYGFLWSMAFAARTRTFKTKGSAILYTVVLPAVLGALVGASCELIQIYVPTRVADPLDFAIDAAGSLCGALAAAKLNRTESPF